MSSAASPLPPTFVSLDVLPGLLAAAAAHRVLLLTGGSARFVDRVRALVGDLPIEVFAGARRHVPEAVLADARAHLDACGADALIALGGGSAISNRRRRAPTTPRRPSIMTTSTASRMMPSAASTVRLEQQVAALAEGRCAH